MPALIQTRDIQVGKQVAWHGLTKVEEKITRENCGIVYAMEKQPIILPNPDGTPRMKTVPIFGKGKNKGKVVGTKEVSACDFFHIVSLDDNLPIGNPVKKGYKLVSNTQVFDMITEALAGTTHEIVSIGTIQDRSKAFATIQLAGQNEIVAGGRKTEPYLNVLWGHGYVFGMTSRSSFTVVVCANTFAMSLNENASDFKMSLRHSGNCELKLENMAKAIDLQYGVAAEFQKAMDDLSTASCNEERARKIVAGFLVREPAEKVTELSARTRNTVDFIVQKFRGGAGNDGNDLCDLFNGFTDYYTHDSAGGDDAWKQYESSEFGAASNSKTDAFNLLTGRKTDFGTLAEVEARGEKILQLA